MSWLGIVRLSLQLLLLCAYLSEDFYIYADGSFHKGKSLYAGWAWVATQEGKLFAQEAGITRNPAKSRNIDGEIYGVLKACYWLRRNHPTATAKIFVDYEGLIYWAKGEWKTRKEVSKIFVEELKPFLNKLTWQKVKAHSENNDDPHTVWNDMADALANQALRKSYIGTI